MTYREIKQCSQGYMHHYCTITKTNGEAISGNFQPFDEEFVYLTIDNGAAGGKIPLDEIRSIDFPNEKV